MVIPQRTLRIVFFVFAALFVCLLPFDPNPVRVVIKTVPALSLSLLALLHVPGVWSKPLALGLLLSAAGDAALGINGLYGGPFFVIGLILFLLAHVAYIIAFAIGFKPQKSRLPAAVLVVAYCSAVALLLRPGLGDMALPVYVYIVVITVMGVLAALRTMGSTQLLLGGMAFILSDSLLAINKFRFPVPAERYVVITTYYFAQYMIAHAFLQNE
jgi:uncharacterized membrane protein YhhN